MLLSCLIAQHIDRLCSRENRQLKMCFEKLSKPKFPTHILAHGGFALSCLGGPRDDEPMLFWGFCAGERPLLCGHYHATPRQTGPAAHVYHV
jgi:hypothetical protein